MLLDEPLSALDLKLRQHMRAELRAIQKRTNVTFIYITHDQGEALAMSDRVAVMSHGKLQQVARPREIYDRPANGFVASFVGESNIFSGGLVAQSDGKGDFKTDLGVFKARLGPNLDASAKLYVRPENVRLSQAATDSNAISVEVSDIAFEGNFISIQTRDASGRTIISEARNDGQSAVPERGERLVASFEADKAIILSDENPAKEGQNT